MLLDGTNPTLYTLVISGMIFNVCWLIQSHGMWHVDIMQYRYFWDFGWWAFNYMFNVRVLALRFASPAHFLVYSLVWWFPRSFAIFPSRVSFVTFCEGRWAVMLQVLIVLWLLVNVIVSVLVPWLVAGCNLSCTSQGKLSAVCDFFLLCKVIVCGWFLF